MKVLVTGKGTAGSWIVRGDQLGRAMGATVKPKATLQDMREHDVIVVVKRVSETMLHDLRKSGRPWVYDIVDAYPQPATWDRRASVKWLQELLRELAPDRVVWPNARMREDAERQHEPVVYHHARPGQPVNPVRKAARIVGYEGSARYIEALRPGIEAECRRRGMHFVLNPVSITQLDIVVAMRGGIWDGYAPRHWKSNVKLANAHASGTPFIGSDECGYQETSTGAEYWSDSIKQFGNALDWLESYETRQTVSTRFLQATYTVDQAAKDMLCALKF